MAYVNSNGQIRVGVRAAVVSNSPVGQQTTISASLLQSLYGVWNGDTTTNELGTQIYGAWNAEYSGTASSSLTDSLYGVWNGESTTNTLSTSLFASYNGESTTNDSFGTNHGTPVGGLTYSSGKIGNAFSFNGSSYVSLPNSSNQFNFNGDFSVSFWVNLTAGINTWKPAIYNYAAGGSYGYGYSIGINEYYDKIQIFIRNNNQITQQWFNYTFSANTWYNVVVCRKSSNYTRCYVNGVLVSGYYPIGGQSDPTLNPSYTSNQSVAIGGSGINGKLDLVNLWTKELNQLEVIQLYNTSLGIEYPFAGKLLPSTDDGFGTNHGTLVNGCTFATGKIGNALLGNGSGYLQLPNETGKFSNSFTINLWINISSSTTNTDFVSCYYWLPGSREYGYILQHSTNGRITFYGKRPDDSNIIMSYSYSGKYNSWRMLTLTKASSSGALKMYIDGVLVVSDNSPGSIAYGANNYSTIGGTRYNGGTQGYLENGGKIDAVTMWSKELTQNEITLLYNGSNGTQYSNGSFGLTQSTLDSVGSYHGTPVGAMSFVGGKIGSSAFNFNGSSYINMGTGAANFGSNPFSVSFWFYPTAGNNLQILIGKGFTGGTNKGFYINTDNRYNSNQNAISFGLNNGSSYKTIATTSAFQYTAGAWNHVIVTRNGDTTLIYLNGVLTTTTNTQVAGTGVVSGDISNASAPLWIGQYGSGGLYYNGRMDGLTMWNRVISIEEVTQLYNSGTGNQYPFTGTFSSAGNQLGMDNGTLMNGCSLTTGKIGQAFTFDGVNDYVHLPTNSLNLQVNFSISLWVNLTSLSTRQCFIGNYNYNPSTGGIYGFRVFYAPSGNISNTGGVRFDYGDGLSSGDGYYGSSSRALLTNNYLTTNTWYHIVVTKKSDSAKIYINGALAASDTNYLIPIYSGNTYPTIGVAQYLQNQFDWYISSGSKIDSVNIYRKELTQSEITELYNSGNGKQITKTPIVQSGLVLNLDGGRSSSLFLNGTTWNDISGNGYVGNINGPSFIQIGGNNELTNGLTFDGVNDYVSFGAITALNLTNITVSTWARVKGVGSQGYTTILSRYSNTNLYNGWVIYMTNDMKFNFGGRENNTQYLSLKTNSTYSYNVWYNITGVKSGSTWSIYINGVLDKSLTLGAGNVSFLSNVLNIGSWYPYDYGFCDVSSVRIYDRVLSNSEILQNFTVTRSLFNV